MLVGRGGAGDFYPVDLDYVGEVLLDNLLVWLLLPRMKVCVTTMQPTKAQRLEEEVSL